MATEIEKLAPGWEEPIEWKLRTLTPIWAGGVKKGHCAKETKSTTLMGSLRYWAEQVCRERGEQVCPGENWCDGANCQVCRIFGSTEQARAFRIEISGLKYSDDHGGLWSDEFRIRIWNRKGEERGEQARQLVDRAIHLFATSGGFGAKTQHGWGQVEIL